MKSKIFLVSLMMIIVVFGCVDRSRSMEAKINQHLVDADVSLYSFIKERISSTSIDSLCNLNGNVVFDMTLAIDSSSIKNVYINGAYIFDDEGNVVAGFEEHTELEKVVQSATIEQFPHYSDSVYGNYGIKIEFTRVFCK